MDAALPTEIICLILGYIDERKSFKQCSFVSKKWYAIVTPQLWHGPFRLKDHCQILASLNQSRERCCKSVYNPLVVPLGCHIRKLVFTLYETGDYLLQMVKHTPFLEDLEIHSQYYFKDNALGQIAQQIPQLRQLSLFCMRFSEYELGSFCRQASDLIRLNLHSCWVFKSMAFLRNCPNLQELRIIRCKGLCDQMGADIACLGQLTRLHITHCYGLKSGTLVHFLPSHTILPLPLLTHLTFACAPDPTINDHKKAFLKTRPSLQESIIRG